MANIKLSELNTAGSELFQDSESFLNDMSDVDGVVVQGGRASTLGQLIDYSVKSKQFVLLGFAMDSIASLAKSFSNDHYGV